ncbi:MAG TPA: flagellar hook-length control protein FliK [Rhodanobacter sp.]
MAPIATADPAATEAGESSETTQVSDETASALAGAMLALMGPAMAGVLRGANSAANPGAASSGLDGKPVVGGGAVTNLLQPGAAVAAAAVANAADVMAPLSALRDALSPPGSEARHVSATELAPTAALHAPPAAPAATTPLLLHVPSPVGNQAFAQELGQQVAWLGGQSIKQARIQLRPEELGALDVKITVHHGRVDVVFNAQHAGAVAAVQQSLPQLDQMLAQHGLSLGHAEVGQQDRGDSDGHGGDGRATASDEGSEVHAIGPALTVRQVGLLDTFA